jgi:hypothetical protein
MIEFIWRAWGVGTYFGTSLHTTTTTTTTTTVGDLAVLLSMLILSGFSHIVGPLVLTFRPLSSRSEA